MNILVVSDIHGRSIWKPIISFINFFDKIVFLGDYWDSSDLSFDIQKNNFIEIVEFKKKYPDKVVLLLGNHDNHYWTNSLDECSGFQSQYYYIINNLFETNKKLFQIAYIYKNILFTHAGVTKEWINLMGITNVSQKVLNNTFYKTPNKLAFISRYFETPVEKTGDNIFQGPFWVRPKSLLENGLDNYLQVVGHSYMEKITRTKNVIFTDCFNKIPQMLVIKEHNNKYSFNTVLFKKKNMIFKNLNLSNKTNFN